MPGSGSPTLCLPRRSTRGRRRTGAGEAHRRLSQIAPNAEERARHLALSAEGPDEDAAAALGEAARAAAARGAPAAAAELAELAAARTPVEQAPARWRRRADAALYLFRAGDTARARHDLEALARRCQVGERAETLLVLAEVLLHDAGDLGGGAGALRRRSQMPPPIGCCKPASTSASPGPAVTTSVLRPPRGGWARAGGAGRRSGAGRRGHEPRSSTRISWWAGAFTSSSPMTGALEREGRLRGLRNARRRWVGLCLVRADRFDEARRLLQRALQAAQEEGDDSSLPNLLAHLADLECWAGNWQAAERYAAQSWEAGEQVDHRVWRVITFFARALIDAHSGTHRRCQGRSREGLSVATAAQDDWAAMMLNGVLGLRGTVGREPGAAEASLSSAADLADRIGLAEPAAWRFHANQAEAVIGLGDLDRAEGLVNGWSGGVAPPDAMDAWHRGPLPGAAAGGPRRHRRRRPGAGGGPGPPPAPGDAVRARPDPARHGADAAQGQAQADRQAAPATGPGHFRVPARPPCGRNGLARSSPASGSARLPRSR